MYNSAHLMKIIYDNFLNHLNTLGLQSDIVPKANCSNC